jgi:hypothetical protein
VCVALETAQGGFHYGIGDTIHVCGLFVYGVTAAVRFITLLVNYHYRWSITRTA